MSYCRCRRCHHDESLEGYCGVHWVEHRFKGRHSHWRTHLALKIAPWIGELA